MPSFCARRNRSVIGMPATPKKGSRFGGDAAHQKAMLGNLVASLIAAEGLTTQVVRALDRAGVPVNDVTMQRASLDDVFLARSR